LEVTGQWPPGPKAWTTKVTKESVTRLGIVKGFLTDRVVAFLNGNDGNGGEK